MSLDFPGLIEEADSWVLPVDGMEVTRCSAGYQFDITLTDSKKSAIITISSHFSLISGEVSLEIDGSDVYEASSCIPKLFKKTVALCRASKDGNLTLEFSDGDVLKALPDEQYEAWQVVGPEKILVVCTPGGDIAVWS